MQLTHSKCTPIYCEQQQWIQNLTRNVRLHYKASSDYIGLTNVKDEEEEEEEEEVTEEVKEEKEEEEEEKEEEEQK